MPIEADNSKSRAIITNPELQLVKTATLSYKRLPRLERIFDRRRLLTRSSFSRLASPSTAIGICLLRGLSPPWTTLFGRSLFAKVVLASEEEEVLARKARLRQFLKSKCCRRDFFSQKLWFPKDHGREKLSVN